MPSVPQILVGVDFSPSSQNAMQQSAVLARHVGARLLLVHAWNPSVAIAPPELGVEVATDWLDASRRAGEQRLASWVAEAEASGVEAEGRFEIGSASRLLIDLAAQLRPLLAVVGRRGIARLAHVMLGSVSERLVNHSRVPVLVVPEKWTDVRLPKRLLVGVDFSPASRAALTSACALAKRINEGCEVLAVHCQNNESDDYLAGLSQMAPEPQARCEPADVARWIERGELAIDIDVAVARGRAEVELVKRARESGCDWLVAGYQGRTALATFLIGSTTDRLLRTADRPILVVPNEEPAAGEYAS